MDIERTPTPASPNSSARLWSSPKGRKLIVGIVVVLGLVVLWRIMAPPAQNKEDQKSAAEKSFDSIVESQKKKGEVSGQAAQIANGKGPDLPTGDPQAIAALTEAAQKKDILADRKKFAEERLLDQLAYQHYIRKGQGLSYDPALAARWEEKIKAAQAAGQGAPPPPASLDKDTLEELAKSRPDLMAQWKAIGGDSPKAQSAPAAPSLFPGAPGAQAASTANSGDIPASIDPKTGLPKGAAGEDGPFALNEDGSPDLVNGAIPIQISYTPPGAASPVTITRWVRPGYLSNRVRSMDPRVLAEQDDAWRRSLAESTVFPSDSQSAVAIPSRITPTVRRAAGEDFTFVNREAVVLPNPQGQKTPPNPPVSGGGRKESR